MRNLYLHTSLCVVAMTLASCAVGPNYKRPSTPVPVAFKEANPAKDFIGPLKPKSDDASNLVKAQPQDDAIRGKWWEVFKDTDLNALEEQVAISNQTVKGAEASFRQARALVAESRAGYFPTVGADVSFTRSGSGGGSGSTSVITTSTAATGSTVGSSGIRNSYSGSLQASWVPDLWGSIRRQVESSKATAQASAAELASATLSAQGELAIDYMDLRLADEQKRILNRSAADFARSLQLTQNQYDVGVASRADVLQAKVQLETTEAQAVDVGNARAQYEHAIALLIGKAPADFTLGEVESVPIQPEIPTLVPSQLLERRPDVAGYERQVAAANAQIGVAEAAFFPSITLSATGGYTSTELAKWFTLPSRFWSLGPDLAETLFDAGLRAAQTEAAIAAYDVTVANYRQAVLGAFQEVEDNLASLRVLAHESDVLSAAVKDAQASTEVALNQYKSGIVTYVNVVTTQTAQLNDEISLLNVKKQQLTAAATLIENLGGGWNAEALDAPEVTQGETHPWSLLPPPIKKQD